MKPDEKIAKYVLAFQEAAITSGWGNGALCYNFYRGLPARIKESIVLEDSEVKHDACVLYSIIGWNSRVGAWARVEGTPTPVTSHTTSIVKNGVKVQSVTILGKECGVGDEIRVQNCVCLPFKELKRVRYISPCLSSFSIGVKPLAFILTSSLLTGCR